MASVVASITSDGANVDLTALGGEDYLVFRTGQTLANGYRKSGGGSLITVTEIDPSSAYSLDEEAKSRLYSGSDATPSSFNDGDNARLVSFGTDQAGGFNIALPAGLGERTAKIYVMGYGNNSDVASFSAVCTLSDASASHTVSPSSISVGADNFYVIDVTYTAASNGQTLNVYWRMNAAATSGIRAVHWGAAWVSTAAGGSTVNASLTEALTSGSTQDASIVRVASIAESLTASHSQSVIASILAAIVEAVTSNSTQSAAASFPVALSEAGSANTTQSAGKSTPAALAEAATALSLQDYIGGISASIVESATATDAVSTLLQATASLSEAANAISTQSATAIINTAIVETASAATTQNGAVTGIVDALLIESANALSTVSATANFIASVQEVVTALNAVSATAVLAASVTENATASHAQSTVNVILAELVETSNATDSFIADVVKRLVARVLSGNLTHRVAASNLVKRNLLTNLTKRGD